MVTVVSKRDYICADQCPQVHWGETSPCEDIVRWSLSSYWIAQWGEAKPPKNCWQYVNTTSSRLQIELWPGDWRQAATFVIVLLLTTLGRGSLSSSVQVLSLCLWHIGHNHVLSTRASQCDPLLSSYSACHCISIMRFKVIALSMYQCTVSDLP